MAAVYVVSACGWGSILDRSKADAHSADCLGDPAQLRGMDADVPADVLVSLVGNPTENEGVFLCGMS